MHPQKRFNTITIMQSRKEAPQSKSKSNFNNKNRDLLHNLNFTEKRNVINELNALWEIFSFSFAIWKISVGLKWRLIGIGSLKQRVEYINIWDIFHQTKKKPVEIHFIHHVDVDKVVTTPIRFSWYRHMNHEVV